MDCPNPSPDRTRHGVVFPVVAADDVVKVAVITCSHTNLVDRRIEKSQSRSAVLDGLLIRHRRQARPLRRSITRTAIPAVASAVIATVLIRFASAETSG